MTHYRRKRLTQPVLTDAAFYRRSLAMFALTAAAIGAAHAQTKPSDSTKSANEKAAAVIAAPLTKPPIKAEPQSDAKQESKVADVSPFTGRLSKQEALEHALALQKAQNALRKEEVNGIVLEGEAKLAALKPTLEIARINRETNAQRAGAASTGNVAMPTQPFPSTGSTPSKASAKPVIKPNTKGSAIKVDPIEELVKERSPAPQAPPVAIAPPHPPVPQTTLAGVVKFGNESLAVIERDGQVTTARAGGTAFGQTVSRVSLESVQLGANTLAKPSSATTKIAAVDKASAPSAPGANPPSGFASPTTSVGTPMSAPGVSPNMPPNIQQPMIRPLQ